MKVILGESATKALLFYVGEPNPETFEAKLHAILGEGASLIILDVKKRMASVPSENKHRRLGLRAWSGWARNVLDGASLVGPRFPLATRVS